MARDGQLQPGQGRRTFLTRILTAIGATAAVLSISRRARAGQSDVRPARASGPILYRRSAETERYYRTLYQ